MYFRAQLYWITFMTICWLATFQNCENTFKSKLWLSTSVHAFQWHQIQLLAKPSVSSLSWQRNHLKVHRKTENFCEEVWFHNRILHHEDIQWNTARNLKIQDDCSCHTPSHQAYFPQLPWNSVGTRRKAQSLQPDYGDFLSVCGWGGSAYRAYRSTSLLAPHHETRDMVTSPPRSGF